MAEELRHDLKVTARNITDGDCVRAMNRLLMLSHDNGAFLAERSWVSRKYAGISRQIDKLRTKFNKKCEVRSRYKFQK